MADPVGEALAALHAFVAPNLDGAQTLVVEIDLREDDECMAVDDLLQFAYTNRLAIPPALLDMAEHAIAWWWDDELYARTLGWIKRIRHAQAIPA